MYSFRWIYKGAAGLSRSRSRKNFGKQQLRNEKSRRFRALKKDSYNETSSMRIRMAIYYSGLLLRKLVSSISIRTVVRKSQRLYLEMSKIIAQSRINRVSDRSMYITSWAHHPMHIRTSPCSALHSSPDRLSSRTESLLSFRARAIRCC